MKRTLLLLTLLALLAVLIEAWAIQRRQPTPTATPPLPVALLRGAGDPAPGARRLDERPLKEPCAELARSTRAAARPQPQPGSSRIDGRVVRRSGALETPVSGVEIALEQDDLPANGLSPSLLCTKPAYPVLARTSSAADGRFAFADLGPSSYRLRARLASGAECQALVPIAWWDHEQRTALVFGDSSIRGIVRTLDGAPLQGARVLAWARDAAPRALVCACSWTDAQGAYAIEGLAAGAVSLDVLALTERGPAAGWPSRGCAIQLGESDEITLDVGSDAGTPHVRGSLRSRSGEPLGCHGWMLFSRMRSTGRCSQVTTQLRLELEGRVAFDTPLEPGEWEACVGSFSGGRSGAQTIHVPAEGLLRDFVLPGTRLAGRVVDAATAERLTGVGWGKLFVRLVRSEPDTGRSVHHEVMVDEQGAFAFDMLEEGRWELTTFPVRSGTAGTKLEFTVEPRQAETQLDVQVQRP